MSTFPSQVPTLKVRFLPAIPGANVQAKVNRGGDTMTGSLILVHDPVVPLEAATKSYVDNQSIISEVVISLQDIASVPLNAALGNVFEIIATGNRTIQAPSNAPAPGYTQKLVIRHKASGLSRTLSLASGAGGFRFGSTILNLSSTLTGLTDYIGCVYNQLDDRWDVVSYAKGF